MKEVRVQAVVDPAKCSGCDTCIHVCPTESYRKPSQRPVGSQCAPPCSAHCPVGNPVEGFVHLVGRNRWEEALELLRETNPLPGVTGRVCNSPCEPACNRAHVDAPVSIRALERAVADYALEKAIRHPPAKTRARKGKVAIVGSGPAGLSCAYHLARRGFQCTVFERKPKAGGTLRYGIPSYRLPREVLDAEVGWIRDLGVDFRLKRTWGEDLKMKDLKPFDAVFLALGFQKCQVLGVPGEEIPGVLSGTAFLERVNSGSPPSLSGDVLVIGGGNSAVDSARAALRLGGRPIVVYRRREEDMPAIGSELEEMKAEGVELLTLATPVRFIGEKRRLTAVEFTRMELGEVMADGRRWPVPLHGGEFRMAANTAILCLGETGELEGSPLELKCEGGKIDADSWGRTSMPRVFAGGDVATGKGTVAHAIGSGRSGGSAVAAYLLGDPLPQEPADPFVAEPSLMNFDYWEPSPRRETGRVPRKKAVTSFQEIAKTISKKGAASEAARCGHCGVRPEFDAETCRGCNNCSSRCPSYAIELKTLETPFRVKVDVENAVRPRVDEICLAARIHPESIVCFCTATRAMEIAAAVVKGAKSPEDVSRMTGARTGCGVLCIEPIFRLLQAAGVELGVQGPPDVWYPTVPTIWSISDSIIRKYGDRGFRFEEDKLFYEKLISSGKGEKK